MRFFDKLGLTKKNQLKRNVFLNIVTVLFVLLALFLLISGIGKIWGMLHRENKTEKAQRIWEEEVYEVCSDQVQKAFTEAEIALWGEETPITKIVEWQLENMKEAYVWEEELDSCKEAELIFVSRKNLTTAEIKILNRYIKEGKNIFFTELPSEEALKNFSVKKLLGIRSYQGIQKKTGIRLTEQVLFDKIAELKEPFELKSVTLQQRTEVYASALEKEKKKDEELAPLFWKYQRERGCGYVYAADAHMMGSSTGAAIISFLFTDIHKAYMYPIVNAYCFAIAGIPYSENFTSSYLEEEFERDSLNVQNDIFFPEFRRCEARYELPATWYQSEEREEKKENLILEYYLDEIEKENGELGQMVNEEAVAQCRFPNRLTEWSSAFTWKSEDNTVQVPYQLMEKKKYQDIIYRQNVLQKAAGITCIYVDMKSHLYGTEDSQSWIDFCMNLESVLGTDRQDQPWLDRVTVSEAIYRILSMEMLQPEITYEAAGNSREEAQDRELWNEEKIAGTLYNFTGKAYFYLSLPGDGQIEKTKGIRVEKIGDRLYLAEAYTEEFEILYKTKVIFDKQ